jgi:hypothetical protein
MIENIAALAAVFNKLRKAECFAVWRALRFFLSPLSITSYE